jgi:hypothetical protein
VRGFKTDVPSFSPLERRAIGDFTAGACCPAVTGRGCCPRCFGRWLRARLMEHWWGEEYWRELDRDDFGILARPFHANAALVADIALLLMTGNENLMIITWALETGQPIDEVIQILTVLDINDRRLPRFAWMLAPSRVAVV